MNTQFTKYIISLVIFSTNGIVASFLTLSNTATIFYRTVVGSIFLLGILLIQKKIPRWSHIRGQLIPLAVSGASLGLGWLFLFGAYQQVGVGTATLLYYLGPAIVMAGAPILFHERVTAAKTLGIAAAFLGMILVNYNSIGIDGNGSSFTGIFYGLFSAVWYAVMIVANKKVSGLDGVERTFWQLVFAALVVIAYAMFNHQAVFPVRTAELLPLAILCIVNTGMACYLYFSSTHLLPAQSVAICSYIDPSFALILSAVFLKETMGPLQMLGAVLILGGAAFGELYRPRNKGGKS